MSISGALPTSAFRKQLCFSVKSRCLDLSKLLVSTLREELHLEKLFQEIRVCVFDGGVLIDLHEGVGNGDSGLA